MTIEGRVSSDIFKRVRIEISRCNSTADPLCSSDAVFSSYQAVMQQFTMVIPLINTEINADSQKYLSRYVEDINVFTFTDSLGLEATGYIQEDII